MHESEEIKHVARPIPAAKPTGYSARDTGGVFLEAESASADANLVHPRSRAAGYYTPIKKEEKPKCMLCYYVRVFAGITFVLVLLLVLYMRFAAPTTVGF